MGLLARVARNRLIRRCEAHYALARHRDDGYDGSTAEIREGLAAAEKVIRHAKITGTSAAYLDSVDAGLLQAMGRKNDPLKEGEDVWSGAGLATMRNEVEKTRRWLRWLPTTILVSTVGIAAMIWWIWLRR